MNAKNPGYLYCIEFHVYLPNHYSILVLLSESRKEKTLIESTAQECPDISAYYRPPEVSDNPPFPFHLSGVNFTGDNQIVGGLLATADRSNPLSGMKTHLGKRGRITGYVPGSRAQSAVARKRNTGPAETTDATTSGRRRRRRNQNGVVSSTTADFFQVADPPAMTSQIDAGNGQKEDWSRDDGNHGAGYHGDVVGRGSFSSVAGFSSSPGDALTGGVSSLCGFSRGRGGDGKHSGEHVTRRGGGGGGRDTRCTQGGDGGFGVKFWQLKKSKDALYRPQISEVEIPGDRWNSTEYERQRHAWMIPAFPQQGETDYRVRWNSGGAKRNEDIVGKRVTENPEKETREGWTTATGGTGVLARTEVKLVFDSCGALDLTLPKTRNN